MAAGTPWALFTARWDNASPGTGIQLRTPAGALLSEADIANTPGMAPVTDLSDDRQRVIEVSNPAEGVWEVVVPDTTGLGTVQIEALAGTAAPTLSFTSANGGDLRQPVQTPPTWRCCVAHMLRCPRCRRDPARSAPGR